MAKQKRKAQKTKPVTANPLFPAVVGLWFGALFGLSSLAVRPSLLEALVIKSRIDLIIPAAAPPLGVTSRILLALGLAALGGVMGATIARRIARPKPEVRERKRGVRSSEASEPQLRTRDSHPDAPARRPISAHEELGAELDCTSQPASPIVMGGRRRSLAIEEEAGAFVPHEMAPLPGGQPQILDIADLARSAAEAEAPLDLGTFAEAEQESAMPPLEVPAPPAQLDWNQARPILPGQPDAAAAPFAHPVAEPADGARQIFHPAETPPPVPAAAADSDPMQGRQVFGMAPVAPQDPATRQIFGQTVTDDHVPGDFVQAAGYQASVFDSPPAEPLFGNRAEAAPAAEAPAPEPAPAPIPAAPLPPVADLGMSDLASRLQESMKRRRAARQDADSLPVAAAMTPAPAPEPAPVPAMPQAFAPGPPLPEAAPPAFTAPAAAPVMPQEAFAPPPVPSAPQAIPAAMRPLSFDDFADDDDNAELASLLPPRSMVMPAPAAPITYAPPPEPAPELDPVDAIEVEAGPEEEYGSLLSLGARNPFVRIDEPDAATAEFEPVVIFPGQTPRLAAAPASIAPQPDVAPVVSPMPEAAATFRSFDAPASAGQGQAVSAMATAPAVDADEAERALRAALSNLQRMSGAA